MRNDGKMESHEGHHTFNWKTQIPLMKMQDDVSVNERWEEEIRTTTSEFEISTDGETSTDF
jgi:hypothetical protein